MYKLAEKDGRVRYFMGDAKNVTGSDTRIDSAEWMLKEGKPYRSNQIEGYPIAVECNGSTYFFEGSWDEPSIFDEPKPRKRRKKDEVLGM